MWCTVTGVLPGTVLAGTAYKPIDQNFPKPRIPNKKDSSSSEHPSTQPSPIRRFCRRFGSPNPSTAAKNAARQRRRKRRRSEPIVSESPMKGGESRDWSARSPPLHARRAHEHSSSRESRVADRGQFVRTTRLVMVPWTQQSARLAPPDCISPPINVD